MIGGRVVKRFGSLVYLGSEMDWRGECRWKVGVAIGERGCCGVCEAEEFMMSPECDS